MALAAGTRGATATERAESGSAFAESRALGLPEAVVEHPIALEPQIMSRRGGLGTATTEENVGAMTGGARAVSPMKNRRSRRLWDFAGAVWFAFFVSAMVVSLPLVNLVARKRRRSGQRLPAGAVLARRVSGSSGGAHACIEIDETNPLAIASPPAQLLHASEADV